MPRAALTGTRTARCWARFWPVLGVRGLCDTRAAPSTIDHFATVVAIEGRLADMYPVDDSDCGPRQLIERQIVRSLVDEILGHDLLISVDDGEEQHPITGDRDAILAVLMETDEDRVNIYSTTSGSTPQPEGSVRLVYGNDGWDVICDYTLSVERYIEQSNSLGEQLSETAE